VNTARKTRVVYCILIPSDAFTCATIAIYIDRNATVSVYTTGRTITELWSGYTSTYVCRVGDAGQQLNITAGTEVTSQHYVSSCRPITCELNDADVTLTCCRHDNEVYVPFDAVERYFEVGNILY